MLARMRPDLDVTPPRASLTGSVLHTPTTDGGLSPFDAAKPLPLPQRFSVGPPGGWLSHNMSRSQEVIFNLTVCMGQFIPQACLTTCFPIIQILTDDFQISNPAILPWIVAAYAVSFGTTILLAGRLGDVFGHKSLVLIGLAWIAMFSILGGLSRYTTYHVFFFARAMQGVGSAMINPNGLALLGRSYPPTSKGKIIAFSAFGLCSPLGAYMGMLGSAVLGQRAHWSWAFFALGISSALLGVLACFVLPSPPKTPKQMQPFTRKMLSIDWLGATTGIGGLVAIQISLVSAGVQGWSTQWIFMTLIIGILSVGFFVVVELKVSLEPLVPFQLLNSTTALVLAAVACGWGAFGVWTFYLWRFLLSVWQDTPLHAALHVLPIVPVALLAAVASAVLMRKTKPSCILLGSLVAFTLGPALLAGNKADTTYWSFTFVSLIITPIGMDMSFPSATFVMSNALPTDKQGVAGSLVTTVVNYSISLGLGLATTVEAEVIGHQNNLMKGIRTGWFFGVGLGVLGILISAFLVVKSYSYELSSLNMPKGELRQMPTSFRGDTRLTSVSSAGSIGVPDEKIAFPTETVHAIPDVPRIPKKYIN